MDRQHLIGRTRPEHEPQAWPPSGTRILIVEDDPMVRGLVVLMLAAVGFSSVAVGSVSEAVGRLRERPPALVLADLLMPDGGGLHLLRAMRGTQEETPVVVVTGAGDPALHDTALSLGAKEVLLKPFTLTDLHGVVSRWLGSEAAWPGGLAPAGGSLR
jgi:CheY-like chemotaxis protein